MPACKGPRIASKSCAVVFKYVGKNDVQQGTG